MQKPNIEIKSSFKRQPFIYSELNICLNDFPLRLWQSRKDEYGEFTPFIVFNALANTEYKIEYKDRLVFVILCSDINWKAATTQGISNVAGYLAARNLIDDGLVNMNVDLIVSKDLMIKLDLPFTDVFEENMGRYIERLYNIFLLTWKDGSRDIRWLEYLKRIVPKPWQQHDLHERMTRELTKNA